MFAFHWLFEHFVCEFFSKNIFITILAILFSVELFFKSNFYDPKYIKKNCYYLLFSYLISILLAYYLKEIFSWNLLKTYFHCLIAAGKLSKFFGKEMC